MKVSILAILLTLAWSPVHAGRFGEEIPMRITSASTFYVNGYLNGYGEVDMMVDTGSSYTTINEATLTILRANGAAVYVKDLRGTMADGSKQVVPVYRIASVSIGEDCTFKNVEAAVFPGNTRYILGQNTLKRAAPFAFSLEPPTLMVSNCP